MFALLLHSILCGLGNTLVLDRAVVLKNASNLRSTHTEEEEVDSGQAGKVFVSE